MGAVPFETLAFGTTANEAFTNAVEDAKYMHGHSGYTGTIGKKTSFTVIPEHEYKGRQKLTVALELIDQEDKRIQRKRGPLGRSTVGERRLANGIANSTASKVMVSHEYTRGLPRSTTGLLPEGTAAPVSRGVVVGSAPPVPTDIV